MKYRHLLFGILFMSSLSCGKQDKGANNHLIDISSAMQSISDISISEFANEISYVALETTDNSLIGNYPDVSVWGDKIVVSSLNQPLMVFDKNTGHFCNRIGHIGDDPEGLATDGWGNIPFWIDQTNGTVYLRALGDNRLLRYRFDGTFLGSVTPVFRGLEVKNLSFYYFLISNDIITAHNKYWDENNPYIFSFNALNGNIINTVSSIVKSFPHEIISVNYLYGENGAYIPFGGLGVYEFYYSDNRTARIVPNSPSVWEYKGQKYLKEPFIDIVYSIQGNLLEPSLTIDLGKWKWPYDKKLEQDNSIGSISIDYMLENEHFIYFHLHSELYEKNRNAYCGFFNKKDGATKIMRGDAIIDDIHNFLPVTIRKVSPDGLFVGLVQVHTIMQWKEKNRNITLPPNIQSLFEKDIEDNPIVVIIQSL